MVEKQSLFAAYSKSLTIRDIFNLAGENGYKISRKAIYDRLKRCSEYFDSLRIGRCLFYSAKPILFESVERDKLLEILPARVDQINARFNQYIGNPSPPAETANEPKDLSKAPADQPSIDEKPDDEYVEAANVGAAIIAYINKLRKKGSEVDPTEFESLQRKYEDKQQQIINLKNQVASLEGQLSKTKKMIDDQNKKIIDLNHSVTILRTENEKMKRVPSTFKLSEIARINRAIKDL